MTFCHIGAFSAIEPTTNHKYPMISMNRKVSVSLILSIMLVSCILFFTY